MIRCVLDEDGCIDMLAVMRIMNQVDQEQVWAIAYELAAQMQRLWPAGNCALIESLAQIHLHRDGSVHEKSLTKLIQPPPSDVRTSEQRQDTCDNSSPRQSDSAPAQRTTEAREGAAAAGEQQEDSAKMQVVAPAATITDSNQPKSQLPPSPPITPELTASRRLAPSKAELVSSLGIALFQILDFGIPDDEERKLSMTMEYLIFKSQSELSLDEILEICIKRLDVATKTNADLHYRGVCKALVDDTIELSIFLERIYTATLELSNGSITAARPASGATSTGGLVQDCCLVAAAAAAKRHNKSLSETDGKLSSCDLNLLGQSHHHHDHHHHHHHHIDYHHLTSHVVNRDDLKGLGLPLASLRALKIDDWARLWMQVIKEMRQRSEFKHLGISTAAGQELGCSNL